MTDPATKSSGRILDASALKALAHPLRFQLIELLIEHGAATASQLARMVDESSGLTSYHLRELAKQQLIEEAPELGSARDRWWRAVAGGYTLEGFEMLQREETRNDARFLLDEVVRARFERLQRWHDDAPRWGREWVDASAELTSRLRLTRDELTDLTDELVAVIHRYRALQADRPRPVADPDDPIDPDGTGPVPVTVQLEIFPSGEVRTNLERDRPDDEVSGDV